MSDDGAVCLGEWKETGALERIDGDFLAVLAEPAAEVPLGEVTGDARGVGRYFEHRRRQSPTGSGFQGGEREVRQVDALPGRLQAKVEGQATEDVEATARAGHQDVFGHFEFRKEGEP
jgi:hypothetical protein